MRPPKITLDRDVGTQATVEPEAEPEPAVSYLQEGAEVVRREPNINNRYTGRITKIGPREKSNQSPGGSFLVFH